MNTIFKWGLSIFFAGLVSVANAQLITSITPNSGSIGQTVDVLIRGVNTHFQNNISHADFGQGILVQNLRVSNPLTATATISITNGAATGFRDVTLVTGSEVATSMSGFEVFAVGANFKANIILIPVETISLSNIDLTKPANTPILFFANIYNDNTVKYISIEVALSSGSRGHIGSIIASPRRMNPNDFLRLTNREFSDVDINGPSGQEFLNIVKSTGTFPPDNYTYKLIIKDNNGTVIATDEGVNVVTNMNYNPELIWPGADFTAPLETVLTPFPVFQWFGQIDKYDFSLHELREGQTPQEAIRNIAVFQQKNITSTSFVYPAYAEKLADGKQYAWQVVGKVSSGKGDQSLPAQPFRFIYKSMSDISGVNISRIEITPKDATIKVNEKLQFNTVLFDDKGDIITTIPPTWNITPDMGYVTQKGLFAAGNHTGTVAVVVKAGLMVEYAVVNIKPEIPDYEGIIIEDMLRRLFGIPDNDK